MSNEPDNKNSLNPIPPESAFERDALNHITDSNKSLIEAFTSLVNYAEIQSNQLHTSFQTYCNVVLDPGRDNKVRGVQKFIDPFGQLAVLLNVIDSQIKKMHDYIDNTGDHGLPTEVQSFEQTAATCEYAAKFFRLYLEFRRSAQLMKSRLENLNKELENTNAN